MTLNALTVDLEEHFQVSNFEHTIDRASWGSQPSRVVEPTRRLLDAFEASGSRATFFTLGWVAERHPALVREIVGRGHEIACHGHMHELVYDLGPARFRADLRRAKATIENAAGCAQPVQTAVSFVTSSAIGTSPRMSPNAFRWKSPSKLATMTSLPALACSSQKLTMSG